MEPSRGATTARRHRDHGRSSRQLRNVGGPGPTRSRNPDQSTPIPTKAVADLPAGTGGKAPSTCYISRRESRRAVAPGFDSMGCSSMAEHRTVNATVVGSTPTAPAQKEQKRGRNRGPVSVCTTDAQNVVPIDKNTNRRAPACSVWLSPEIVKPPVPMGPIYSLSKRFVTLNCTFTFFAAPSCLKL